MLPGGVIRDWIIDERVWLASGIAEDGDDDMRGI